MIKRCTTLLMIILSVSTFPAFAEQSQQQNKHVSISRQGLISNSRVLWENERPVINPQQNFGHTRELRILAIRVDFREDDDYKTTGNGSFILTDDDQLSIDPAPHDHDYFSFQLEALTNYYRKVSAGMLELSADVSSQIFTLPHEMSYYSPATGDDLEDIRLAELFLDAIHAADSSGVQFSNYDCFIVFHAGVGKDINLGYDPTPNDIPSAFLNQTDLADRLPGESAADGIPVQNNSFFVKEGIILPETENQEGYEVGLLGTMTLMFGFQLGLPALWDVETGRSGIGRWGLMDQGSGNYNGLIPAQPCAWTKVFLGWEQPVEISSGIEVAVSTAMSNVHPKIYKVPINSEEYFLIENRQYDTNGDSSAIGIDANGISVRFRPDGFLEASSPVSVIVSVDEYDYGLPGSGILIWHIDEKIILDRLVENRVNTGDIRGVDLEEADGAQDIGESYGFFSAGGGSENGVLHDAWFAGNEINKLVNSSEAVIFNTNTYPNSNSNSGADSHIEILSFSTSDTVMTFSLQSTLIQAGFPVDFGPGQTPYPPLYGDIDGDGSTELIVATLSGNVYAWNSDGTPLWLNGHTVLRIRSNGDSVTVDLPLIFRVDSGFPVSPVLTPDIPGTRSFVITVDGSGALIVLDAVDDDGDGYMDIISREENIVDQVTALAFIGSAVYIGSSSGKVKSILLSGDLNWEKDIEQGRVTDFCQNRDNIIAATELSGFIMFDQTGREMWRHQDIPGEALQNPASASVASVIGKTIITGFNADLGVIMDRTGNEVDRFSGSFPRGVISGPALGDLNGDGRVEIAVTGKHKIWLFNQNGSLADYFPVPHLERNIELSAPVLGDVDGDGTIDIVAAGTNGNIEAYNINGTIADGFPLSTGSKYAVPPALIDLDDDGDTELIGLSGNGYLYVWDLPALYSGDTVPWGSYKHDPQKTSQLLLNYTRPEEPGGDDLLPKDLAYNYPNPAMDGYTTIRYRLEKPAEVTIRIYNLTGHLKAEFKGRGDAPADNEVTWDLSNVASGVYFCEVKAVTDTEEAVIRFRIGVVK